MIARAKKKNDGVGFYIMAVMIAIGIIGVTLPLMLVGFLVYVLLDNRAIVRFILPDKSIHQIKVKEVVGGFSVGDKKYLFDHRSIIFNRFRKRVIYYYWNNPQPIVFGDKKPELSSQDLYSLLETKLIKDLFSSREIDQLRLLLFIVLGVVGISLLFTIFYNPNPPVELADTPGNRALIDSVIREVLGR